AKSPRVVGRRQRGCRLRATAPAAPRANPRCWPRTAGGGGIACGSPPLGLITDNTIGGERCPGNRPSGDRRATKVGAFDRLRAPVQPRPLLTMLSVCRLYVLSLAGTFAWR